MKKLKDEFRQELAFKAQGPLDKKPEWMSEEFFELHNLIQKRAIEARAAVEEMSKLPFSAEQAHQQEEFLKRAIANNAIKKTKE